MSDRSWNFYVDDEGRYAGINDGRSGDTLLRIGGQPGDPGHLDVEKVREFETWASRLAALVQALEGEIKRLRAKVEAAEAEASKPQRRKEVRCSETGAARAYQHSADNLTAILDQYRGGGS